MLTEWATVLLGTHPTWGVSRCQWQKSSLPVRAGLLSRRTKHISEVVGIRTDGVSDVINANWTQLGFNFRFTDILASIGLVQLKRLPERIEKVKVIYARYAAAMPELSFLSSFRLTLRQVKYQSTSKSYAHERDKLVIPHGSRHSTRPFYPDLNLASYFESTGRFPLGGIWQGGNFLPSGPEQPLGNVERVLETLLEFGEGMKFTVKPNSVAILDFHDGSAGQIETWFEQVTGYHIACFVHEASEPIEIDVEDKNKKRVSQRTDFPHVTLSKDARLLLHYIQWSGSDPNWELKSSATHSQQQVASQQMDLSAT